MKLKSLALLVIAALAFSVSSCKKEKLTQPLIQTSPEALYIYGRVGEVVSVNVNVYSDINLDRFYVTSKLDNSFQVTSLDSAISGKEFSMLYEFKIPKEAAGKSIVFTYNATDVDGNKGADIKRLIVEADSAVVLVETTGHQIFSGKSLNNKDAFNLETNAVLYSLLTDSVDRDIQDYPTDTTEALSRSWVSPAHGKFVRFNGFDYANATDVALQNAYQSGAKLDIVSNIQLNDIILCKLGSVSGDKYAVIKITGIVDVAGKESDSYLFSVKK